MKSLIAIIAGLIIVSTSTNALAVTSCPQANVTNIALNGEQTFTGFMGAAKEKSCTNDLGVVSQFNFSGRAGQKVFLEATSLEPTLALRVYLKYPTAGASEATGPIMGTVRLPQSGYMTLPTDGDYWFFLTSTSGKAGGAYSLKIGTDELTPESGWWWNPAESGRGFAIEKQGNSLMVAGFLYDAAGAATWYMAAGPMDDATTFRHSLDAFTGGQCITCAYKAPAQAVGAGSIEIKFTSGKTATVTWSGGVFPLQRFNFGL